MTMRIVLLVILVASVCAEWPELKPLKKVHEKEKAPQEHVVSLLRDSEETNFFDLLGEGLKEFMEDLGQLKDEDLGLNSTTESGFNDKIEGHMLNVKSDLCADYNVNTNNSCSESTYMGCNCHDHFGKIESTSCSQSPCFIAQHIWDNAAKSLSGVKYVTNLTDLVELGLHFSKPIMEKMCECNPSFYEAAMSCVKDYNGELLEKKDRRGFKKFVKKIKLHLLKDVLSTMTAAYCGGDATCIEDFNGMVLHLADMLDISVKGEQEDQCDNFRRMSDTIMAFLAYVMDEENNHTVNSVLFKITKIPHNFWCGEKDCKEDLSKSFNDNCCFRDAVKKFDLKLINKLIGFVRSIFKATGSEMPKISRKTRKRIVKVADPAKMCRGYKAECDKV